MVPSLTSSVYGEERGLRCAVVCDSTNLRTGLGRRCCARSKSNRALTRLDLEHNNVGNACASALAAALEATVWSVVVLGLTWLLQQLSLHKSAVKSWRRQVAVQYVF